MERTDGGHGPAPGTARDPARDFAGPERPRGSPAAFQALRVAVTLALVAWIAVTVDWGELGRTVRNTDLFYLTLSLLVALPLIMVNARKWQILLRALSVPAGYGLCFQLYLVSKFFNNFLPTHVGGDVVRGMILGRREGRTAESMASVVAERITGLAALLAVALLVLAWDRGRVFPDFLVWGTLAAVGTLGGAVALILSPGILAWIRGKAHLPLLGKLGRFQGAMQRFGDHRRALLACLGLSLVYYALAAVNVFVSARAFGAPLSLAEAAVATPVILVIVLFPISMGGIGLMEWAYIFVLGHYGVGSEAGLSTALLMRGKTILVGLTGGLVYMARSEVSTAETSRVPGAARAGASAEGGPGGSD